MSDWRWYIAPAAVPGGVELLDGSWLAIAEHERVPANALRAGRRGGIAYGGTTGWHLSICLNPPHRLTATYRIAMKVWTAGWCETTIRVERRWPRAPYTSQQLLRVAADATNMARMWREVDEAWQYEPQRISLLPSIPNSEIAIATGNLVGSIWTVSVRERPHAFCECAACLRAAPRDDIGRWFWWRFRAYKQLAEVTR